MKLRSKLNIRRLFQARTQLKITFADSPPPILGGGAAGAVSSKPLPDGSHVAFIPDVRTAFGRTVRLHEADHLQYSSPDAGRRRFITDARALGCTEDNIENAWQGYEDAFLATRPVWDQRPESVKRDAQAVALRELRTVKRDCVKFVQSGQNTDPRMLDRVRAAAINCMLRHRAFTTQFLHDICSLLQIDGAQLLSVVRDLKRDAHGNARAGLLALLTPAPIPKLEFKAPDPELTETDPDFEQSEDPRNGFAGGSSPNDIPTKIVRPALTTPTLSGIEGEPTESFSSSGYRIRRSALVPLGLGLPCSTPFVRTQEPSPGGVVIIDASGSMGVEADKLRRLCSLAPANSVAYYSGGSSAHCGYVVVYAANGKRLDDSIPLPNLYGGNVADEQALLWAYREHKRLGSDKPIILVSDLGFCGNSTDSIKRAFKLVENGQRDGSLQVITTIQGALAHFARSAEETES